MAMGGINLEDYVDAFNKPVKDSGKRDEFDTGAVRDIGKMKGAYELISPIFLRRLAIHLEKGAAKYEPHNWRKGMPLGRTMQSLLRHAFQYLGGDRSEDHLAAIGCNIMFLTHYEECIRNGILPKELDDLVGEYKKVPEDEWLRRLNCVTQTNNEK